MKADSRSRLQKPRFPSRWLRSREGCSRLGIIYLHSRTLRIDWRLLGNRDLIDMVKLGKASLPIDLMSYAAADQQPSIFYLRESDRQSILTVFNWTDGPRTHTVRLADLGLAAIRHLSR